PPVRVLALDRSGTAPIRFGRVRALIFFLRLAPPILCMSLHPPSQRTGHLGPAIAGEVSSGGLSCTFASSVRGTTSYRLLPHAKRLTEHFSEFPAPPAPQSLKIGSGAAGRIQSFGRGAQ